MFYSAITLRMSVMLNVTIIAQHVEDRIEVIGGKNEVGNGRTRSTSFDHIGLVPKELKCEVNHQHSWA